MTPTIFFIVLVIVLGMLALGWSFFRRQQCKRRLEPSGTSGSVPLPGKPMSALRTRLGSALVALSLAVLTLLLSPQPQALAASAQQLTHRVSMGTTKQSVSTGPLTMIMYGGNNSTAPGMPVSPYSQYQAPCTPYAPTCVRSPIPPLGVKVLNADGTPASGVPATFSFANVPNTGTCIGSHSVTTDANGIASFIGALGCYYTVDEFNPTKWSYNVIASSTSVSSPPVTFTESISFPGWEEYCDVSGGCML